MARLLCYALGAGLGHVMRQLSLARRAGAAGHEVRVLCSGPLVPSILPQVQFAGVTVEHLGASPTRDEVCEGIHARLSRADFDLLIVDTFPRGLAGELGDWLARADIPAVWVHRILSEAYARRPEVAQAVASYGQILLPGERGCYAGAPRALWTPPWLLLPPSQWLPRGPAQAVWGARGGLPLLLVVATGTPAEIGEMLALGKTLAVELEGRAQVRVAAPGDGHPWPLLRYLSGVDVLVAAGGYNTVHEARATGTSLLAFARKRRYDLQHRRLQPEERVTSVSNLRERLDALLSHCEEGSDDASPEITSINWNDGAKQALASIETLL